MSQTQHGSPKTPDDMLRLSGKSLLESGMFADVTVTCKDKTWKLHKAIICPRSPYFLKAFDGNFNEAKTGTLILHDQNPKDVDVIITFLYTGEVPPNLHKSWGLCEWVDFLKCSDFFGLDSTSALVISAIKSLLYPRAKEIVQAGKRSERLLRLGDAVLEGIFYMAESAYNTGSALCSSTLQKPLLDFMVSTKFYACADSRFYDRLQTMPLFATAIVKHMMPTTDRSVVVLRQDRHGKCTKCSRNLDLALITFSQGEVTKGTCWDCCFK
ncbi:BTB/POZ protein [Biscogniauxia marginata]|nr:BTB/POZ protein [Biscogniauxia marginata]